MFISYQMREKKSTYRIIIATGVTINNKDYKNKGACESRSKINTWHLDRFI